MHQFARCSSVLPLLALVAASAVALEPQESRVLRAEIEMAAPTAPSARARPAWRALGASLEEQARSYLRTHAGELALADPQLGDLELLAIRNGKAQDVVRFRQTVGGLPVHQGQLVVTIDREGRVVFVGNAYRPIRGAVSDAPRVDERAALATAHELLGVAGPPAWERRGLVVYPGSERARLTWRIETVPAGSPGGQWEVFVDATTGEVLRAEEVTATVDGTGQAFFPNPLASANAQYGDPGFVDGNDADTAELVGELTAVSLLEITLDTGTYSLVGPWAECLDFETPAGTCPTQASSDFSYASREDDRFEAVNTYFHIDTFMRYLNDTLGLTVHPTAYAGGVQYDPRGLDGADNSHYLSGPERLAFGEGGVDDAEDSDVVIHELGHGIHDWVTNNNATANEGLGEGTGDYVAVSYMRSYGWWTPSDPEYNWVFGWDGHNPFWGGRVTTWNDNHHYPEDLTGSIHTDGQFWSSCNIDIWEALGREPTDTAFVEGLSMTAPGFNLATAAQAVLQAAVTLGYSDADLRTMDDVYDDCGFLTELGIFADGFESGDVSAWSFSVP